jgi:hypothetical protein
MLWSVAETFSAIHEKSWTLWRPADGHNTPPDPPASLEGERPRAPRYGAAARARASPTVIVPSGCRSKYAPSTPPVGQVAGSA